MISIIIPAYNVESWISACLDSVLGQTFADWECVCVNDGSSDRTGEILDEYAKLDHRFKVVHQRNLGVSYARNAGIDASCGSWLTFVDGDDLLHPDMLQRLYTIADAKESADIVRCEVFTFDDGDLPQWRCGDVAVDVVDCTDSISYRSLRIGMCGAIYRRQILPKHGFRPYCRGEDLLFVGECLTKARCECVIKFRGYAYRMRNGSAMKSTITQRKLVDRIGYSLEWLEAMQKSGKQISLSFYRSVVLNLTESFVFDLLKLPSDQRQNVWRQWYEMLVLVDNRYEFPFWSRCVIKVCRFIRLHVVAVLLCAVPQFLKLNGLHR